MNADDSTILYRILSQFKSLDEGILDRQLGFLCYLTNSKTLGTPLVASVELQPPWGCRIVVTPSDDLVVRGDLRSLKMLEYVTKTNDELEGLSRLNFDVETGEVSCVCHMFYDEPPTDEELVECLNDPVNLLTTNFKSLQAIVNGDFSALDS